MFGVHNPSNVHVFRDGSKPLAQGADRSSSLRCTMHAIGGYGRPLKDIRRRRDGQDLLRGAPVFDACRRGVMGRGSLLSKGAARALRHGTSRTGRSSISSSSGDKAMLR